MSIWRITLLLLITGCVILSLYGLKKFNIWPLFFTVEQLDEIGQLSVVKDIRGNEPYMTFKMSCFFYDDHPHGGKWSELLHDTPCHVNIFQKCFRNRTLEGRQETHVIKFIMEKNIRRCACTDIGGWCSADCSNFPQLKCCLDRGKDSVLCRR